VIRRQGLKKDGWPIVGMMARATDSHRLRERPQWK
jgi:hypothetical protein